MPSNLHLPEFRVTQYVPGVLISDMNGYYIRAANQFAAELAARKAGVFTLTEVLRVQYWKDPLYPLPVG